MDGIDRRTFVVTLAGAAGIVANRTLAHEGHDHGEAATPDATPEAELGTGTGAVFMTIRNNGDSADVLVDVTTDVARSTQIHESVVDGANATMHHVEHGLEIPADGEIVLEPSGYHVMLIDLNEDLLPDSTFTLTLAFEVAGTVELTIPVATERLDDVPGVSLGDLEITGYWSRPAPRLSPTSGATPAATPKG